MLVTSTWGRPRTHDWEKPALHYAGEEIARWREERDSCPDYASYLQELPSLLRGGAARPASPNAVSGPREI